MSRDDKRFEWLARAACAGRDPEIFFRKTQQQYAVAVCGACPVRAECVERLLELGVASDGVVAGLRPKEQRLLLRRLGRAAS